MSSVSTYDLEHLTRYVKFLTQVIFIYIKAFKAVFKKIPTPYLA